MTITPLISLSEIVPVHSQNDSSSCCYHRLTNGLNEEASVSHPPRSLPSLLTLTALSVYISVSASLYLEQQRRQPVSTYRHACRPAPARSLCQKQSTSAAPTRPRCPATKTASLSSHNTLGSIHSCLNISRPSVPAVFLGWIQTRIFIMQFGSKNWKRKNDWLMRQCAGSLQCFLLFISAFTQSWK